MLNSHSALVVPHPPHILRYFTPLVSAYGDLEVEGNFRRLARDVSRLIRVHICPWEIRPDVEKVVRTAQPRNLFGIFVDFYEQYREAAGKQRWGCKSTFMIDHVDTILERFPKARLIYLVRDARDVAASSKRSVFNPYHPYFTAQLWQEQQDRGSELLERLSPETIRLLRYEDLIQDVEGTVRNLCEFLGEAFEPGMLQYFETSEAQRCSRLSRCWIHTASPIRRDNSGRFRSELSPRETWIVESLTARGLQRYGYALTHAAEARPGVRETGRRLGYWLADRAMGMRVELRSLLRDKNHWRRWARAVLLAYWRGRAGIRRRRRSEDKFPANR